MWRIEYWKKTNKSSWGIWGTVIPGAPEGHHSPSKGWDGPKRLCSAITRDRGHAHPPSAPWQGLTPLWSRGAPTLCLLEFCIVLIQPHMEWRHVQDWKSKPFLPLFFALLPLSLTSLPSPDGPSCFRCGGRSLSGCLQDSGQRAGAHWEGNSTALTLLCCSGKGSKAPRDVAGSWGM